MPSDHALARLSHVFGATGLRIAGKLNVPLYRLTRGRLMGKVGRAPVLLITTTGRRSGQQRTAPVLYLADGERLVVIGSNAGYERPPTLRDMVRELRGWDYPLRNLEGERT